MTSAYPLDWPPHIPRAKHRETGSFRTALAGAIDNVEGSLRAFGKDSGKTVSAIVLSSNVALGVNRPDDPGVAVWFTWEGQQICIPVDRYSTPAANLQAIHHVLEARRTELRHGTLALVRASMQGLRALPAPERGPHWSAVLGLPRIASRREIEEAYVKLARAAHPDNPEGSTEAMQALNIARDQALQERP